MGVSRGLWIAREAVAPARTKIPRVAPQLPLRAANRRMPVAAIENAREISAKARATHRFDFPRRRCGISNKEQRKQGVRLLVARGGIEPPTRGFSVGPRWF